MKISKSKSKFSSALNYFVKKSAIGSLIGIVMLSSTLIVSPDLVAHANSADASTNSVNYELVASKVAVSAFKDVKTDHYAYDAIQWAKSKGIVGGYSDKNGKPNGLFGPSDNVTEAQFVKMIGEYLSLKDTSGNLKKTSGKNHWADSYYDAMAKHGVPLNGYFDDKIRSKPIKRGTLAQALGYLLGNKDNLTDSINYMLSKEITSGQNPQYEGKDLHKYFGSTNNLTRAQVAAFLYRMDTKSINTLGERTVSYSSSNTDLNVKAKSGTNLLDRSLVDSNRDKSSSGGSGIVLIPGNNDNGSTTVDKGSDNNIIVKESASYYKEKGIKLNVDTKVKHNVDNMLEFEKSISSNTLNLMNKGGLKFNDTTTYGYVFLNYDAGNGGLANVIGINYKAKVVKAATNDYEMLNAVLKDILGLDIKTSTLKSSVKNMKDYTTINLGKDVTVQKDDVIVLFRVNK